MIDFNVPPYTGNEMKYIQQAVDNHKICGDGEFTCKCSSWMKNKFSAANVFLTTSCTHALEMASILTGIGEGDEVIMPSYTFVSTADAFVLRGAKIVFVDIRPDTMNLDERLIEDAVTERTKVIVPMHYAGVSCEMDKIMQIARKHHLMVVEDAAQGVMSTYKGRALGTIGDFGCYSFHETKNYSMGEGGAILFNDSSYAEKAEIVREKGTNRSKFFRGQVDKYTWMDFGSSYLPSELNAAYLWAQMEMAEEINADRLQSWNYYDKALRQLAREGLITQPYIPEECVHNAHMYYIKAKDLEERTALISYLKAKGVQTVFHYVPLHSAPAGLRFGRFYGEDRFTTSESERLVRLPMYYHLTQQTMETVINGIYDFYKVQRKYG